MLLLRPFSDKPEQKTCSVCAASFTCGPEKGKEECWCDELPHLSLVTNEDQGCACPKCLSEAISKFNSPECGAAGIRPVIQTTETSTDSLVEGEDFYREGVVIVFTAHYHLRRGYCCQSGCRHCPYREITTKDGADSF